MSRRKEREQEERDNKLKIPPELAALEAELAALRPAEATFGAEAIFDRASSRRVARKMRTPLVERLVWLAAGFVAGAVLVAAGFSIWRPTRNIESARVERTHIPVASDAPAEKDVVTQSMPPASAVERAEDTAETLETPGSPGSRYTVLARGDLDMDRLDEYLDRMNALAKRTESAADQWRRSRPYYWSQTARDSSREEDRKSWDEYRALINSAGAGELLSL